VLDVVHTRKQKFTELAWRYVEYEKLHVRSLMIQTYQNNLSFSLYTALFVYYVVTIFKNWIEFKIKVSADIGMSLLNAGNQVQ